MPELNDIIQKFKEQKVLVVGDLMVDEYVFGEVSRISPEAPIPILDAQRIIHLLGGAANVAYNVKALGGEVFLAGIVGDDEKAKTLKNNLSDKGIGLGGVITDATRKTTVKTRIVARNQQVVRVDNEDKHPIDSQTEESLLNFIKSQLSQLNAIILSDYDKGVIVPSLSQKIIALAKEKNILCLADPKGDYCAKYRGCDLIKPNEKELARALNISTEQLRQADAFARAGWDLLSSTMCSNILVSRGGEGMVLFQANGGYFAHEAINRQPADVSGAGDTAMAVLALALASGADLRQSITLASYACGIEVAKIGTAAVSSEELCERLEAKNN